GQNQGLGRICKKLPDSKRIISAISFSARTFVADGFAVLRRAGFIRLESTVTVQLSVRSRIGNSQAGADVAGIPTKDAPYHLLGFDALKAARRDHLIRQPGTTQIF